MAKVWRAFAALAVLAAAVPAAPATAGTGPLLGVYYGNQGWAMRDVAALESWQGHDNAVVELFTDWNSSKKTMDNLFGQQLPNIWANGNVPLVTWEPFTGRTTPDDVEVRAARGDYDAYLTTWAGRLRTWLAGVDGKLGTTDDRRAYLRLAHEPNGNWYPWSGSPDAYVRMWQRVRGIVGANVPSNRLQWIWAVNNEDVGGITAASYWPGDAYVDWVGIDGYNWGSSQTWSTWRSPGETFDSMLAALRSFTSKPVALTEVGSTSQLNGTSNLAAKKQWISTLYTQWAPSNGIRMVVWFDEDKETDWAVFGGSTGDSTYKYGRTTYRALSTYRTATAGYASAITSDAQFAGSG